MAKKVKFPLDMGNDVKVRSIEELKENYNAEKVTEYFLNGKLLTWLEDRYYDEAAEQVRELSEQSENGNPAAKLGEIFGIETKEEVDVEALEIRREKLEKLRKITADDEIIKNIDFVAFSQEELGDLLDEEAQVIYLCGESFYVPMSVKNVRYVGVNDPVVTVSGKGDIDLKANGIVIEQCKLSENTEVRLVPENDRIPYTNEKDFDFLKKGKTVRIVNYNGFDSIIKIPNNVTEIGGGAFNRRTSYIKKVILPKGITRIGYDAFKNCVNLEYINIPDSVRVIEVDAFYNCTSLEKINIPDSVKIMKGNTSINGGNYDDNGYDNYDNNDFDDDDYYDDYDDDNYVDYSHLLDSNNNIDRILIDAGLNAAKECGKAIIKNSGGALGRFFGKK